MLCPAQLKGGGDLSEIWGKHAARVKEAIPLLRQGLRCNEMEAKRLLNVPRFMLIDERNVAEELKWKNEHLINLLFVK
jgi:hypothetical protein